MFCFAHTPNVLLNSLSLTLSLYLYIFTAGSVCRLLDGSLGICKPFPDCKWLTDELASRRVSIRDLIRFRCSFEGSTEIVCCGDEHPTEPQSNQPMICRDSDDICFE